MSQFAKMLLVATSLAPSLVAFALVAWEKDQQRYVIGFLVAAALLVLVCYLLKLYAEKWGEHRSLTVTAVESTDKEALAFMIAYLFPILMNQIPDVTEPRYQMLAIYTYCVIGLVIYHSNSFHFNPVLALFGYHFYEITADQGMKYLLITHRVVRSQTPNLNVTRLSDYVYLELDVVDQVGEQEHAN
ncbi:MAG: hypothetical protein HYV60_22210 [Planctomycetia bacterium]|nr:hypothetical protein [Planctomycetia bacterium]